MLDWRALTFWLAMLGCALAAQAFLLNWRSRKKDKTILRNHRILKSNIQFQQAINALPPTMPRGDLSTAILKELREVLDPFQVYVRLWIANKDWRTLEGHGEHPALRPGSSHHLPMTACPAYALRRPFQYNEKSPDPCKSEQFNFTKHLCLPIANEQFTFGVLFLGGYGLAVWDSEQMHHFELLSQSIAQMLQRRALIEKLEEKVSDLNFSFEVGSASLATFGGSTQSIEETTVRILDSVISILHVDRATLMLWDPKAEILQTQWVRGGTFKVRSPLHLRLGEGMAGWALKRGEAYWAEYAMGDPHYCESTQRIQSLLCVPVFGMDRAPIGVINAVTITQPRTFLQREIDFLTSFGHQAALAIENARLHQKSRDNIDQLNEIQKLKSQFLSLVSHDLRGPLTGIRGFSEILKQESIGALNQAQREILDQFERQVELQERMVEDLLDLARMEKNKFSIHPAPTNMVNLLKEEVDKSQREAHERKIHLTLTMTLSSESTTLSVDAGRIRQVLWNLIHNALKFTGENGRIEIRAKDGEKNVILEVEDTGIGLALNTQEHVFDKFFQVSPGGSTSSQGLGLGLAICKEIVQAHHGTIQAYSLGLGKGTTISITLPRQLPLSQTQSLAA